MVARDLIRRMCGASRRELQASAAHLADSIIEDAYAKAYAEYREQESRSYVSLIKASAPDAHSYALTNYRDHLTLHQRSALDNFNKILNK